jgi:hypothetical protein
MRAGTGVVAFVGSSLPAGEAAGLLPGADIRPPVRRGDLPRLSHAGLRAVAIVDGVFQQSLAVSPREVRDLLDAGVALFGGASMGALRAAELHPLGMVGVGAIFEWYRDGVVTADDEVALLFEPESGRNLSVPLVNARHALARAVAESWLGTGVAAHLLDAMRALPYGERRWAPVLATLDAPARAGLSTAELAARLARFDLKRDDATACLLAAAAHAAASAATTAAPNAHR